MAVHRVDRSEDHHQRPVSRMRVFLLLYLIEAARPVERDASAIFLVDLQREARAQRLGLFHHPPTDAFALAVGCDEDGRQGVFVQ